MKYSLINLNEDGNTGFWLQNFVGSIIEAKSLAKDIEAVNNNKIKVIVVDEVSSVVPILSLFKI